LVSVTDAWMSGRGAYYVEMIAKHGLVAIHTASSSRLVAPPGGISQSHRAGDLCGSCRQKMTRHHGETDSGNRCTGQGRSWRHRESGPRANPDRNGEGKERLNTRQSDEVGPEGS